MIETKKIIVKLPRVGYTTLVGYINAGKWPMLVGNCFSMVDNSLSKRDNPELMEQKLGRVVNIRAEDFQYLIKNSPELIENLEVEVITVGVRSEPSWIVVTDKRIKDWLVSDVCSVCVPSVIKEYLGRIKK